MSNECQNEQKLILLRNNLKFGPIQTITKTNFQTLAMNEVLQTDLEVGAKLHDFGIA